MRSNAVPRSASAPLEDSTGATHIVEGGVRVEMVKIESAPISKSVQATKAVPVVAFAVPFYESECQERTSSRQSAQQKLLWHSALTLDGARQSGPNAGVGSTTSFLA